LRGGDCGYAAAIAVVRGITGLVRSYIYPARCIMEVRASVKQRSAAMEIVTASVIGILVSLVLILLAALLIKSLNLADSWLAPLNQSIKGVSLLTGALIAFKNKSNGWVKGLIFGIIYVVLAFLIFSLIDMTFSPDASLIWDLLLGAGMGVICGVIAVNLFHSA
jgi:putative membrane protein (TIGR04086 family)